MRAESPVRFIVSKPIVYLPAVYHILAPVDASDDIISFFFCNNQVIPAFPAYTSFAVKYCNNATFWAWFFLVYIASCQNKTLQSKLPAVRNSVVFPPAAIDPNEMASSNAQPPRPYSRFSSGVPTGSSPFTRS